MIRIRRLGTRLLNGFFASLMAVPQAPAQKSAPADRPPQGPVKLQASPADLRAVRGPGASYVLTPANCGTTAPVLTFTVQVINDGGSPSSAQPASLVYAVDSSLNPLWMTEASLPAINPGQSVTVRIGLAEYSPALAMGGNAGVIHDFRFPIKGAKSYRGSNQATSTPLQIAVSIPAAFCMKKPPGGGQPKPKGAAVPTPGTKVSTLKIAVGHQYRE